MSGGESFNCKDKNVYIVIGVGLLKSENFYVGKLFLIKGLISSDLENSFPKVPVTQFLSYYYYF